VNATARIAAAVAGGYLLGRTKKLKMAITVGSMLAGQRISTNPRELLRQGAQLIESNPELAKLSEQVRSQLIQALRAAAVSTASDGMNQISDAIHNRTERLAVTQGEEEEQEEPEDLEESAEPEDEASEEEDEQPEDEASDEEDEQPEDVDDEEPGDEASDEEDEQPEDVDDEEPGDEASDEEDEKPVAKRPAKKSSGGRQRRKPSAKKSSTAPRTSSSAKKTSKKSSASRSTKG